LRNLGAWMAWAILTLYLGKEFIDWTWWYHWEDDEDEPNPGTLLCSSWPAWLKLEDAVFWLWFRLWRPVRVWLRETFPRLFPRREPPPLPMDKDGRNAVEWLAIAAIGVWNLEWYDGEYDKQIKQKWDEFVAERHTAEPDRDAPENEPDNPD